MNQEEILELMESREIWTYDEISKVFGVKLNALGSPMNKLLFAKKIVKRTNGRKAFVSLKKHADILHRFVDRESLTEEEKLFVDQSKTYDKCFSGYMQRRMA